MTEISLSPGHQQAITELRRIAVASQGKLAVDLSGLKIDRKDVLIIEMDLDCADTIVENEGVQLHDKEHVTVFVPSGFPFQEPAAFTHNIDLATQPHVLWGGYICLYQVDADWDASDGMMGFINRLAGWFLRAASGTLDAPGDPIDPPITYTMDAVGCVVIDPNLPDECTREWRKGNPWCGVAVLYQVDDDRADVLGWIGVDQEAYQDTGLLRDSLTQFEESFGQSVFLAPAIVLPRPMNFEFPLTVEELAIALDDQEVAPADFVKLIGHAAWINRTRARPSGQSVGSSEVDTSAGSGTGGSSARLALYVFVGSPMRGTAGTAERQIHLAAWRLGGDEAQLASRLVQLWEANDPALKGVTSEVTTEVVEWIREAPISWATVYERRPKVVERRDDWRPVEWLRQNGGRVVLILGCGALGAPIAEHCLRGGARKLILVDNKPVTPGVLVRQPYDDSDIGHPKAETLARRLSYIGFRTEVVSHVADAMDVIAADDVPAGVDLIIDATANQTVAARIELRRWTSASAWPPILTVGIGHHAERGFAALALPNATGAGADLIRKLAMATHAESGLSGVADDFFPEQPRADTFVPEPGCSGATFRGSAPEVQALASYLFAGVLGDLRLAEEALVPAMSARVVQLANADRRDVIGGTAEFTWAPDITIDDAMVVSQGPGYQIRMSETALADMRDEACMARDAKGSEVETGGTLFGQIDAAARIVWVTAATGPAPDSIQSQTDYKHGTEGVSDLREVLRKYSAGRLRFVGIWHTHPYGVAFPSELDEHAMNDPAGPVGEMPPRSLLVIVGGETVQWEEWLNDGGPPQIYARLVDRGW